MYIQSTIQCLLHVCIVQQWLGNWPESINNFLLSICIKGDTGYSSRKYVGWSSEDFCAQASLLSNCAYIQTNDFVPYHAGLCNLLHRPAYYSRQKVFADDTSNVNPTSEHLPDAYLILPIHAPIAIQTHLRTNQETIIPSARVFTCRLSRQGPCATGPLVQ